MSNKKKLKYMSPDDITTRLLAGENIFRLKTAISTGRTSLDEFADHCAKATNTKKMADPIRPCNGSQSDMVIINCANGDYDKIYHRGDAGRVFNLYMSKLDVKKELC